MADVFTPQKRSQVMAQIKSKNTEAERIVFRFLRNKNIHFIPHYSRVVGKPDIALARKKKAVFIDGDFWHGREFKRVAESRPKDDYWVKKIAGNMERDIKQRDRLRKDGWRLLCIWDSDIKRKSTRDTSLEAIKEFLVSD